MNTKFICSECKREYSADTIVGKCECGGLLDLDLGKVSFDPDTLSAQPWTLWRYKDVLPVSAENAVSLGEGCTPMVSFDFGPRSAWAKQEQLFPSGSYKDRGAAVLISKARELSVDRVVEDSSGNAGAAVAAYCARASIGCEIYCPDSTSPGKLAQIKSYGADLVPVPGSRDDTARAVMKAAETTFYASHCFNPFFFHGTKTYAYEVTEQLGWNAPDTVILPAGNGTLLLGAYIGFSELIKAGVISAIPKIVAVQPALCAPLAPAFEQGIDTPLAVDTSPTLAEGIAIGTPVRGPQMLEAVRASSGIFITVEEAEIGNALARAAGQGFFIEPTTGALVAAATRYLKTAPKDEIVVVPFTGHGLKAAEKVEKYSKK